MSACSDSKRFPAERRLWNSVSPFFSEIPALETLPEGTLDHAGIGINRRLNDAADFFGPRDTSVSPCDRRLQHGNNWRIGLLAVTATQIGFPADFLLNILAHFRALRFQPKKQEMISQTVAFGSRIGLEASALVLQRWEEGWDKPLNQWREDLGVKPVEHELFGAIY